MMNRTTATLTTLLAALCCSTVSSAQPLKVYILAGQSNMEGHARVETFDYIGEDPATAPLLKTMRDPDGKAHVCKNVWISYLTGWQTLGEGVGRLTAGYGARGNPAEDGGKIGPEFTFGLTMEQATNDPILIIKTAWGGKSLNTDFRSPSAGPYTLNAFQRDLYAKQGKDLEQWKADKAKSTGHYYRLMIDHVKKVLADPARVCPAYDAQQGYEIAGFVWFQGWNDMCDGHTYPNSNQPGAYAEYTELMAHFIRDVRRDLEAPDMPFVIGVIGVDGDRAKGGIANLRPAMAAPAEMPEFKGTVAAVETAPYWDHDMAALQSKKGLAHHRLSVAHVITEEGVMEEPDPGVHGWTAIGSPRPEDRIWRFFSFDAQKEADLLTKKEKKRFRDVALPAGLEDWAMPGFDDSQWRSGKAPIGKGTWNHRLIGQGTVQYKTEWGEGEFILMRTTFEVDNLDCAALRLAVLARQGFHVYLNGHRINTYIWWKDEPQYRPIPLEPDHVKHLKLGKNVLAIYANAEYDRRTEACFATTDLMIEGISKADLAYVNSQAYIDKQMHRVCTPEEAKIIRGCSNGGYHYLGSAKIMAQIGKAFAEAMLKMQRTQDTPQGASSVSDTKGVEVLSKQAGAIEPDAKEASHGKARFDPVVKDIEGWTVHVDPQMLEGKHAEAGARALTMLANHLQRIAILLPEDRLAEMRTLEIWIEHDSTDFDVEPGPYHPSVEWLTERGYEPRLARKVHVTRAASLLERHHMLKHPAVILHELAHAYHHQILGFDEPRIKAAYDRAIEAGLYRDVLVYTGQTARHYAATNHMEYFAEGTEAYFYRNDFYPFVRAQLAEYDPVLHALLKDIWGAAN